ncbi:MAG: 1-acyl-sn-glycerol-3-phosphate acyltransferase [Actinobacteria bacterium]|nr:1-acyl-sn-glycerol-3-phosphate acyltransferase [Actinomycetota bacterium]MBV8961289.1 1-acyl-sn-glycerol-3-phosphate acyltransferase [Actinomycetota bacterium]MBV9255772.1 1-acyl-sn-glycerol-3-phosphate acyltransferase [Actinomycetota bacterium]
MAYWVLKAILTPVLRFLFKVRVEGLEHVPTDGPAILASNHVSFSDSIFLPLVLKRRITFVAKAEYFEDPKTAWFFRAVGQIPIKREGGSASQRALDSAREVLEGGGLFGIYPEGTRSPDGRLYKGHTGVARLAMQCKVPILPVAMVGTREAQPIGQVKPNFFMPITIRIGRPMAFERQRERADDPQVLRSITDEVMFELRELSGQEYVNTYAKRKDTVEAADEAKVKSIVDVTDGAQSPSVAVAG